MWRATMAALVKLAKSGFKDKLDTEVDRWVSEVGSPKILKDQFQGGCPMPTRCLTLMMQM
jgi:hypothetical protein